MTLAGYLWDRCPSLVGKLSWDVITTQVNSALHPSGSLNQVPASAGVKAGKHCCRVAGNTVSPIWLWFPVAARWFPLTATYIPLLLPIGGQHNGHLPFWLPASVNLFVVVLHVLLADDEINTLLLFVHKYWAHHKNMPVMKICAYVGSKWWQQQ